MLMTRTPYPTSDMRTPVVLIIGEHEDWSATSVADQLTKRGVLTYRLDTADFPQRMKMSAFHRSKSWSCRVQTEIGQLNLEEVTGVYYRKPRQFDISAALSEPERRFARAQARVGVAGLLSSMRVRWMSHPSKIADAEYKPGQLDVAAEVGLQTPATLITNDPEQVREFATEEHRLVIKPLAEPIIHEGGGYTPIYARLLDLHELDNLVGIETTAHMFQAWVPKRFEVRVTAVGREAFAVAIHANSEAAHVDWRSDYTALRYEVIRCPKEILDSIHRYLDSYELSYGAFDFVVTPDGSWFFLECNASGQWGWLAEECQLPIAATIADELARTD